METPKLHDVRRRAMEHALGGAFKDGLRSLDAPELVFFDVLTPSAEFAHWAAYEYMDTVGPWVGDTRVCNAAIASLEAVAADYTGENLYDQNVQTPEPYFVLLPATHALLTLTGAIDAHVHGKLVTAYAKLFDVVAKKLNRLHDYLNPRGMECAAALNLHHLTGEARFLDRATECLDELLTRQYPCGAQPYHTGGWIWGRKPAQVYQALTATTMLRAGRMLGREDAIDYVRRLLRHMRLTMNRWAEPFVTTSEGLHKSETLRCATWQWPLAAALGEAEFSNMAWSTYRLWLQQALDFDGRTEQSLFRRAHMLPYLTGLANAAMLNVSDVPPAGTFAPEPGIRALPDISTIVVHEPGLDACMSLLSGYSAFAEADCGSVKLFAVTPELTDAPTSSNAGTDAIRLNWREPSEQTACAVEANRASLAGKVWTMWEVNGSSTDPDHDVHQRALDVRMTYENGELRLDFHTTQNRSTRQVSARLLFMLIARPGDQRASVQVGDDAPFDVPPAYDAAAVFQASVPVAPVRFCAPDGSHLTIIPEICRADAVVIERPPRARVAKEAHGQCIPAVVKSANEGSLRIAFEGPRVLDQGCYRIRFQPGASAFQ